MFVLELLGTLSLRGESRPVPMPARQKRPLGLLAVLAMGGRHGLSRDRLEAYLWPESRAAAARHSLDQTVYAVRQALGNDLLVSSGRELRLDPDLIRVDVWELDDAIQSREWTRVVERYTGALLDGVHLADSRELEAFVDAERTRLLGGYRRALVHLDGIAGQAGDHALRVEWCRRLANTDPLSAPATKQLMLALVAAGDRVGAVRQARVHQQLVRQQLEMEPDREIEELAASVSHSEAAPASVTPAVPARLPDAHARVDSGWGAPVSVAAAPIRGARVAAAGLLIGLAALLIGAATVRSRPGPERPTNAGMISAPRATGPPPAAARGAYRRGVDAWTDGSRAGLDTAVASFRRAIDVDPGYAEAYSALATAYAMLGYFGYHPGEVMFPRARDAALQSLRLDSSLAAPHPALAYALMWERDFVRADSEFRKAVSLEPPRTGGRPDASEHQWYPVLLMLLARKPEVAIMPSAPVADPVSLHVPVVELAFTKWIDGYPTMTGFTSDGPGTMTGAILSRIDDGTVTHLVARYELSGSSGAHALKTVVQGVADDALGQYELDGVVAWGWMTGARVHASFRRKTPCRYGKLDVCFSGTIRLRPR